MLIKIFFKYVEFLTIEQEAFLRPGVFIFCTSTIKRLNYRKVTYNKEFTTTINVYTILIISKSHLSSGWSSLMGVLYTHPNLATAGHRLPSATQYRRAVRKSQ